MPSIDPHVFEPFEVHFSAPQYQPFRLEAGKPAVLLVHGFPGTPNEMRALAESLHRADWTAEALLLPGFGAQVRTIFEQRLSNWEEAVSHALQRLQASHQPVLLGGFSLGAALSIQVAAQVKPDGLLLFAPFSRLRGGVLWNLLPVFRRLFPVIRPFRLVKIDYNDPDFRRGMQEWLPEVDPSDPQVQRALRDFAVPVRVIDEVIKAGMAGWEAAPAISCPTLVVQGCNDELVRPAMTHQLIARMPGPLEYIEVPAVHDLPDSSKPAWPRIEAVVNDFARRRL